MKIAILLTLVSLLNFIDLDLKAQVPNPLQRYPLDAHLVPVSEAFFLQRELNTHNKIILEPANYGVDISIKSNQEIYGLPGTRLGNITVEEGTSHAVISGVRCSALVFPESEQITKENLFIGLSVSLVLIKNARLENNRFVNLLGKIIGNSESTGYLRNNRFIRTTVHTAHPQLFLSGNDDYPSYGNVFLWFNFLSGKAENAIIKKHKNVAIAGVDAEIYSNGYSLFDVSEVDNLTLFGVAGRSSNNDKEPLVKLDVNKALIYSMKIEANKDITNIKTGENAGSLAMLNSDDYNIKLNNEIDYVKINNNSEILLSEMSGKNLNMQQKNKLKESLSFPKGEPWKIYEHDTSLPERRPDSVHIKDHTEYLQSLIDSRRVVLLDSGVYYISRPLVVEPYQVLIGWGKGKTVIRALSSDIDMIENQQMNSDDEIINRPRFNIAQLSLENGRNGICYSIDDDGGRSVMVVRTFLSNVEFYNMSNAGIHLDYSNCNGVAFDNNMLDHLDFFKCKYGIKQSSVCDCSKWPCPYVDKTAFYRCRFIGNNVGVDLSAKRQNNNNAWIECLFKDNQSTDISAYGNANPVIALCQFESPLANHIIKDAFRPLVLNSLINSGKPGATLFSGHALVEGVIIKARDAELFSTSKWPLSISNSTINGKVSISNLKNGILYNNRFEDDKSLNKKLIQFKNGESSVILEESSNPAPGILIDHSFIEE